MNTTLPPADYTALLQYINTIDPIHYGKTRNYGNGAVTRLSPYISRGVISTRTVYKAMLAKGYKLYQMEQFVKELCWRDYFQRVLQHKKEELINDSGRSQPRLQHQGIPKAVLQAETGITAIDHAIQELYNTGYLHNHLRMYLASIVTNVGQYHWQQPAAWMYYHLLDADFASNTCSWQWVCGVRSNKLYFANQENINKYFNTQQQGTFLDVAYEAFDTMPVHTVLQTAASFTPKTVLPDSQPPHINTALPTLVYNLYNLDPLWHADENANRVLLLEPSHFTRFPVSDHLLQWVLTLAQNIKGIQVFTGEFKQLQSMCGNGKLHYKEHPLFEHYKGIEEPRDWVAPEVAGYYPSFFAYWKQVEKALKKQQILTLF